jgi:UDP-glucose 4-epimerase
MSSDSSRLPEFVGGSYGRAYVMMSGMEDPTGKRVLVTGVGGLIGSHVARRLHELGASVIGCDSFITGRRHNVPDTTEFAEADCRDIDRMRDLCSGAHVVIHCAATPYEGLSVYSPHFIADQIYGASAAVFSAALSAGVRRIVFTSSMARYGAGAVPFVETQPVAPVDPYGVSKVAAEMLLQTLCTLHACEYVIAVPHNVVGPGQRYDDVYRNVAAIMINRALSNDDILVYGDGEQRRCFTHVGDVADQLCALAVAPGVHGEIFNLGSDTGFITVNELARRVIDRTGARVRVRHLPPRHGEVRDATCNHDRIEALMGHRSTRTLDDALDALIAEVRALGPRIFVPDLPLEIDTGMVPETWLPDLDRGRERSSA